MLCTMCPTATATSLQRRKKHQGACMFLQGSGPALAGGIQTVKNRALSMHGCASYCACLAFPLLGVGERGTEQQRALALHHRSRNAGDRSALPCHSQPKGRSAACLSHAQRGEHTMPHSFT